MIFLFLKKTESFYILDYLLELIIKKISDLNFIFFQIC